MGSGLLDTSVLVDLTVEEVFLALPSTSSISALSIAELSVGPVLARDPVHAAQRQRRLEQVLERYDALPFDTDAAESYAQVVAAISVAGKNHRSRIVDLMIAATSLSRSLPLYTRNAKDLVGLGGILEIVEV